MNECTLRDDTSILDELNALIRSFKPNEWVYFDSEFNTCLIDELDTQEAPKDYFTHYYGDYFEDFVPAKMKEAGERYGVIFMDKRRFWYWLATDGKDYYESLPIVERARLNMDMTISDNWGSFENLGPNRES
jgi:hypothetical protein